MKTYLQSTQARLEEWRVKRKDTEEWMRHRQLPPDLQDRVRRFVQYQWLATRGVDEEDILNALPLDLKRQIQRHLCLGLVRRVSSFHTYWLFNLLMLILVIFSGSIAMDTCILFSGSFLLTNG